MNRTMRRKGVLARWTVAAGAWMALIAALAAQSPEAPPRLADGEIAAAVGEQLLLSPYVLSQGVEVSVAGGVVTLSGEVPAFTHRRAAQWVAEGIKGVTEVRNEIVVEAPPRLDVQMERALGRVLADGIYGEPQVKGEVRDGVVTLTGAAGSFKSRQWIEERIGEIPGVRGIENRVTVDSRLRGRPLARVASSGSQPRGMRAESEGLRERAEPVRDVGRAAESGTLAAPPGRGTGEPEVRREPMEETVTGSGTLPPPPATIHERVRAALSNDARIAPGMIEIAVEGPEVTLSGAVASAAEKRMAYGDAWVAGVESVNVDGLEVRWWAREQMIEDHATTGPAVMTDEEIGQTIDQLLSDEPRLRDAQIEVRVADHAVQLAGRVKNALQWGLAEWLARQVESVWTVENRIEVKTEGVKDSRAIVTEVREALAADERLRDDEVNALIDTSNRIRLEGTVKTPFERLLAARIAAAIDGVAAVTNELKMTQPGQSEEALSDEELVAAVRRQYFWNPILGEESIGITAEDGTVTLRGTVETWSQAAAARQQAYQAGARYVNMEGLKIGGGGTFDQTYPWGTYDVTYPR